MKKTKILSLLWLSAMMFMCLSCAQKEAQIPVTTDSEKALELYQEATKAMNEVYVQQAMDLLNQALEEDPNFFMAAYNLATINLYFGNTEEFKKYAAQAVGSEASLSEGEEIMKKMIEKQMEDPEADVTDLGKQLVEMYPEDPVAYNQLAFAQMVVNNYEGVVETLKKELEVAEDSAAIYNQLGYAYMELGQYDSARSVFDLYVEMEPDLPNPYDSRGDYYMKIEDYGKAYENYMKAYEIDSTWSYSKALKAKALQDTLQAEQPQE
jgi:tetratricopeptide (TPR) repeat protein